MLYTKYGLHSYFSSLAKKKKKGQIKDDAKNKIPDIQYALIQQMNW